MPDLPLAGTWTLRPAEGGETLPMAIPGDVHSALLAAGRIPDPYWGRNEREVQWVGARDWIIEREVTVDAAQLACAEIWLTAEGLDTIADVAVNGTVVGHADNQFRRWRWEVKRLLRVGANRVAITLRAAGPEGAARAARIPYRVPWSGNNDVPHMNQLRKTQCHAGWDWGICLVVAGIYDDIRLECVERVRLDHAWTGQRWEGDDCTVTVTVEVHAPAAVEVPFAVDLGGHRVERRERLVAGLNHLRAEVRLQRPRRWWPAGHGEQHLHDLAIAVGERTLRRRLGLRTIELVNQPDERGVSMTFRVNGRDVFCKGANWIPSDALPGRESRARYADLLRSAVDANMNMLRVWGGGQFERDAFYELCDEMGLLLWHDMMFACSLYPADKAFLANVREEVLHQAKRLRDHACIALWCGDNECIGALNWYPEAKAARERYVVNWARLNDTLRDALAEADPTRVFWPSSPCAGPGDFADGWHDDTKGDMHYWSVWHGGKGFDAYFSVKPRFCSEFGYQSFSSHAVASAFCPPEHRNITSPTMEHHQKNRGGNAKINEMFARYFRMPEGFRSTLWLSQLQQALAIKSGVEFWRHQMPACMGTLYWQLNDNWPVASWSSLEYDGGWKQLHHHARRFYQPAIVTAFQTKEGVVEIWAVNDAPQPLSGEVRATVRDLDGAVVETLVLPAEVPAGTSRRLAAHPVERLAGERRDERFLWLELAGALGGRPVEHRNEHAFTEWKRLDLRDPGLSWRVEDGADGPEVVIAAARPAFFVTLEADGLPGRFTDNSCTLVPGAARRIGFRAGGAPPAAVDLARALVVTHLQCSYTPGAVAAIAAR